MLIPQSLQLGLMGAGTLIVALLACENKLDNEKLEKGITDMFEEQLDLEVTEVDCPKDVKVEKGKEFDCEVTVKPKGKVPVVVEITDDTRGDVSVKTKHNVLIPAKLKKEGLDCGEKVEVLKPGKTLECKKDGITIKGKVNDDEEVEWKAE